MTAQNDLDRTLGSWFEGDAISAPLEPLARVIESTRNMRPRPALIARVGSRWVGAGSTNGPWGGLASLRPAMVVAIVTLLALALVGAALLVGSRLLVPRPAPQSDVHEFVSAPDLSRPMAYPLLAPLPDGRVLVIGGGSDGEDPTPTGIVYDPATGVSVPVEALTDVLRGPVVRLRDGRVLIIGDGNLPGRLADEGPAARVFDPTTLRLEPAGPMAQARSWPAAAVLHDGRVLIAGGGGVKGELLTAELFDPDTLTFSPTGSMGAEPNSLAAAGSWSDQRAIATLPDGRVFVPTSRATSPTTEAIVAEIYDPSTGAFSAAGTMPKFDVAAAIVIPGGRVVVVGSSKIKPGLTSPYRGNAAVWDPTTRTFSPAGDPPHPVVWATLLNDGRLLLIGGRSAMAWAGIYDPASGVTIPIEPPSWQPSLVRLDDGSVLAVGGLVDGNGRIRVGPNGQQTGYEAPSVPTVKIFH
jgi:hypothetical protein